ncbi:LOW QUALITY PROTEIN: general transcription factor IIE subunit 1-like [Paramacrobiotus metropolitanus]|uniref:LOW QUALITY PROTEIN: general transcription factor IIE subunit 1-like n=1 Tax=Paramacrobiotus metropolitanus TaxID=2943436 RepID=UPI002445AEEF|nr:LOW QUALITY PROTEIN: general transcription factor IIE subunit 1-like [Paramacrobiotus metropolitanus]
MAENNRYGSSASTVPYQVKQLARMVVHGFYGQEHGVIADILCSLSVVEEDVLCILADLVKLDKKQLRQLLAVLKADQIVKTKMGVETGEDGKSLRCTYYFIDYPSLLNMVKYKLELIRKKVETQERNTANRESFKCKDCEKTFSDLHQVLDPFSMSFKCTFCGGEVDEEMVPAQESRVVMMTHFNESTSALFDLIHEIDSLNLTPAELQADMAQSMVSAAKAAAKPGAAGSWSDDTKSTEYNYVPTQDITVTIGETESKGQKAKERPVWLTESTVFAGEVATSEIDVKDQPEAIMKYDEVMLALMRHESHVYEEDKRPEPASEDELEDVQDIGFK